MYVTINVMIAVTVNVRMKVTANIITPTAPADNVSDFEVFDSGFLSISTKSTILIIMIIIMF